MAALNARTAGPRRIRSERGAEIIELALVTPLFLLLIAAMFDFGFLFRNWEVVTNAAREGARMGVLPDYACDASTTDVKDRIDAYMSASGISDKASYTVDRKTKAFATAAGNFTACVVFVELTQPLPTLGAIGKLTGGAFGNVPVRASAIMRTEAQAAP
ncbi:MAG TPA: TadE family protein [Vicinamibacterales bacterium]|nr:TadE family protein [Vicinamibacterales bacterium]